MTLDPHPEIRDTAFLGKFARSDLLCAVSPTPRAFVLLPVIGTVLQGSSSITYATVSELVRAERHSRGFALIYTIASAASIAGPIAFGLIGDGFGLAAAMLSMAVVVLVPLPLSALLGSTPARDYA